MKKYFFFIVAIILILPNIASANNYKRFWLTDDLDNYKGIIEDSSGSKYLIEYGIGCLGFWRYEGSISKELYIDIGGSFLDGIGDTLYLTDDDQSCRIWDAKSLESSSVASPVLSGDFCEDTVSYSKKVGGDYSDMAGSFWGSKNGETSFYYDKNCEYPLINSDITYMSGFVQKNCNKSISYQDMFKWGKVKSIDNNWDDFNNYYLDLCSSKINNTDTKITSTVKIDSKFAEKLKGKILLQVESHGEAWYINPTNNKKYYMADGAQAYNIMRDLGVGITNNNLNKILNNKVTAKKYSGKIFLKVEDKGQAYYIDFSGNAMYLKDGESAYNVMRELGLGIKTSDLEKIQVGE